jgi:hypothetical protein
MPNEVIRSETPEERELHKKISELNDLETELAQRELDLATLQIKLRNFEAKYLQIVGIRYAELDELRAQIAEAEFRLRPKDTTLQDRVLKARAQAKESAQATKPIQELKERKFEPSETLKKLYREVAKRVHPDLTADEKERALREQLMASANVAYEEGDEAKLRSIIDEWENSPESVKGEGISADLIRVTRKIAQIKKRLYIIETETIKLEKSDLYQLKIRVEQAENKGRDLLAEMASRLDKEITLAKKRLTDVTTKGKVGG